MARAPGRTLHDVPGQYATRELNAMLDSFEWGKWVGAATGVLVLPAVQELLIVRNRAIVRSMPCSTASRGLGTLDGSNQTPTGWHEIQDKIGSGLPCCAVLRGRVWTGYCHDVQEQPPGDLILSRILWLGGMEDGHNKGEGRDSRSRYIYIHGTNHEQLLGTSASHGCVRLSNVDVIELFDAVDVGVKVLIAGGPSTAASALSDTAFGPVGPS